MSDSESYDKQIMKYIETYDKDPRTTRALEICDQFRKMLTAEVGAIPARFALRMMLEQDNYQAKIEGVSPDLIQMLDATAMQVIRKVTGT